MSRERIVALRREGLSYSEIATRLGVTKGFVAGHLYRERKGIRPLVPLELSRAAVEAELAANGNNRAAAARRFGVHRKTIDSRTDRPTNPGAARKPCRSTDPEVIAVMKAIDRSGLTDGEVADRSGVSSTAIQSWRAGRNNPNPNFLEWVREAVTGT